LIYQVLYNTSTIIINNELLGFRYSGELRKVPTGSHPATTHLICTTKQSAKYKAAKSWGLSTISIRLVVSEYSSLSCKSISFRGLLMPLSWHFGTILLCCVFLSLTLIRKLQHGWSVSLMVSQCIDFVTGQWLMDICLQSKDPYELCVTVF